MQSATEGRAWNWRGWIAAWILVAVVVGLLPRTSATFVVDIESPVAGKMQVYFDRGNGFSERDSVTEPYGAGRSTLVFGVSSGEYRHVRFDPGVVDSPVGLRNLRLKTSSASTPIDLGEAVRGNVQRLDPIPDGYRVVPTQGTNDPQLVLARTFAIDAAEGWLQVISVATGVILALMLLAEIATARYVSSRQLIAAMLLVASTLALCLAVGSGQRDNDHPDEFAHALALKYHLDHGLVPPAVDDPRVEPSISVWGFSYLFETDIVYPMTALALKLTGQEPVPLFPRIRLFDVALLMLLAFAALRSRAMAAAAAVALLSPQIWYVYSYYNADCVPLTAALLLVGFAADEEGSVARFVRGETWRRGTLVAFVLVAAVLLCSKRNYLTIFPVVGMWLAIRHAGFRLPDVLLSIGGLTLLGMGTFLSTPMFGDPMPGGTLLRLGGLALLAAAAVSWLLRVRREDALRKPFVRLLVVGALCVFAALPRHAWDFWQNGSSSTKAAKMVVLAERFAGESFKPSALKRPDRYNLIAPIRNDVSLNQILWDWGWILTSLRSAYGFYGYMTIAGPIWLAMCLALLSAGFFCLGAYALWRRARDQWGALVCTAGGGAVLVVLSSLFHSWVNSFNPQGRYLFPAFVLLALPLVAAHRELPKAGFRSLLLASAGLSAFSFVFVAFAGFMKL